MTDRGTLGVVATSGTAPDGKPLLAVDSAEDLLGWLETDHDRDVGVWLVRPRKGSGLPELDYEPMICALLAYGWIDSTIRRLDDQRAILWVGPRRKGSVWSAPNKERVARLEADGGLQPPGRAVVQRAKADGSWTVLDGPSRLEVPPDLAAAFAQRPGARTRFDALPPSARKGYLAHIALAKTEATRQRRIEETVARSEANLRPGA